MSEGKVKKIENNEFPKKKGGCLQGCLTFIVIFVVFGAIVGACFGNEDEEGIEETPIEGKQEVQTTDENALINYAQNITGSTFVKSISLVDNNSVIDFYDNFQAYKTDNPNSSLTDEDYKTYFETGEAIEKILVVENVRLLRQFPTLDGVKMTLPYDGKTYSINMNRDSINEYLGFKVEELKVEDDSWVNKFVNPIGYDESKRKELLSKFGTVQ